MNSPCKNKQFLSEDIFFNDRFAPLPFFCIFEIKNICIDEDIVSAES